jgi:hypothetical protein
MHAVQRRSRSFILCVLMLWVAGCGGRSVKEDLELYIKAIVEPLDAGETKADQAHKDLPAPDPSGKNDPTPIIRIYREITLPTYRDAVKRSAHFKAATPQVKAINDLLQRTYAEAASKLSECIDGFDHKDEERMHRAWQALEGIDFAGVQRDLQRLAESQHVLLGITK